MSPDSPLHVDETMASLIASLYLFASAIGPFFASSAVDAIGFRRGFILFNILMLVSWAAIASTWSIYALYAGRILSGFTQGILYLLCPLYVAEVSEDSLRSAMNSVLLFFRCFGILMQFVIGPFVTYHTLIIVNSVAPALFLVCSPWMPESPYHLVVKGKKEEAKNTVSWLRGGLSPADAETTVTQIQEFLQRTRGQKKSYKDLVASRGNVKGLMITTTLIALQQLTGVTAMLVYTQQLFAMTGPGVPSTISAIIYGIVYLIGSAFGPIFAKQFGYRKPLILSGILIFTVQFVLGTYLYFYANGLDLSGYEWLPITCVLTYAAAINFAIGPMPWAIMAEIFPPNIKGLASSLSTTVCFVFAFLVIQFFPVLSQTIQTYGCFWLFSSASLTVSIFTAVAVPDTKGLSLDQIQEKINKHKPSDTLNECEGVIV